MRWKPDHKRGWRPWFAWYPVYLEDIEKYVWLERVEKHRLFCHSRHLDDSAVLNTYREIGSDYKEDLKTMKVW
jgi:hypothetical protein